MSRVIVSIMSDQTIQNYIFIKEKYRDGDELLFISSGKMDHKINWITSTLSFKHCTISKIIFENNEEEKWDKMSERISKSLTEKNTYIVNLTGGTKYMSMAVLRTFDSFDSTFYYIPFPKNEILSFQKDEPEKLSYSVTIDEYLSLFNVLKEKDETKLVKNEEYTKDFFNLFVTKSLTSNEKGILDKLRLYRDSGIKDIEAVASNQSANEKKPQVIGLSNFLRNIDFTTALSNQLSKYEIRYLTGGWFEEYIYSKIISVIQPKDIALGLKIKPSPNTTSPNDLDVVFTLGNKFFVIECKTGISGEKMLHETVYKASALKETLFGLPGNTFIFSLATSDEKFDLAAKNMGITYYDQSNFTDEQKWKELAENIMNIAKV